MLCIFHASCADGFASAWLLHRKWPEMKFHAAHYGQEPPWRLIDREEVIIVDFSYKRPVMQQIIQRCESLVVLDHHKTAAEELAGLATFSTQVKIVFDMTKSGAMLTWEWLFPDEPAPQLIEYVQDRDLWTWALPQSREVSAYLQSVPFDFDTWNAIANSSITDLIERGSAILAYQETVIRNHAKKAVELWLAGSLVPVVNATTLISEIGNLLASEHKSKMAVMYFDSLQEGKRVYSLRSVEGGPDVSAIAARYGGGGHPRAAGFGVSVLSLPTGAVLPPEPN